MQLDACVWRDGSRRAPQTGNAAQAAPAVHSQLTAVPAPPAGSDTRVAPCVLVSYGVRIRGVRSTSGTASAFATPLSRRP